MNYKELIINKQGVVKMQEKIKVFDPNNLKKYECDDLIKFKDYIILDGNSITIKNYPYGFRLRTDIHYYIETNKKGGRFVSRTINPKSLGWNKPKKSTYNDIALLIITEKGFINYVKLDFNDDKEQILQFKDKYLNFLSPLQKKKLSEIMAYNKVMENVTITINEQHYKNIYTGEIKTQILFTELKDYVKCTPEGVLIDDEKEKLKEKIVNQNINKMINIEAHNIKKEII
jgi:hypothetical protein